MFKLYVCVIILLVFAVNSYGIGKKTDSFEVRDQLDRVVKLRNNVSRIVSLAPSITEIIFSLKVGDRLVGVTKHSNYPEEAKLISSVGSYIRPDLEKIITLNPDLCFAIKDGNPIEVIDRLEMLGIPVYVVNPSSLESVLFTVSEIGFLLDVHDRAIKLVNLLKNRIKHVKSIVSKSKNKPKIFFQIGITPMISAGNGTCIDDLIDLACGTNVVRNLGLYPRLTYENVLRLAPEIIVITSTDSDDELSREKVRWEKWSELPAVLSSSIFVENADLFDRPSPRLVDGLEVLARRIHPELFEKFS